ncbi:sigma-70 family RNA polymerase sigma factor [Paenibacillus massiliensis]|uniref:sigma-70 family RNA polymerase sigma factor n=1 Tax=Paenibacillus massiliensis TaxID=225917 RepID=UPI000365020A|nr:sigma-70 family RNA polymerase sigma factor [Paenibacillus massiliensis]
MSTYSELIIRAKQGDPKAFQELVHADKEKLYRMAYIYMGNEEDALEVFQETIYKAFKSISTLQNNQYYSTWMTRILINTALALLRRKQKVIPFSPEILENHASTDNGQLEDQLDLLQALDTLEEKYKSVLLLRFYKDFTIKQIAEILDIPEGTVKTHIHRGLSSLRQQLKGAYDEDRTDSFL